jgi:hypothetical protein
MWVRSGRSDDGRVTALVNLVHVENQMMPLLRIVLIDAVAIHPQVLYAKRTANRHGVFNSLWYVLKTVTASVLLFGAPNMTEACI